MPRSLGRTPRIKRQNEEAAPTESVKWPLFGHDGNIVEIRFTADASDERQD